MRSRDRAAAPFPPSPPQESPLTLAIMSSAPVALTSCSTDRLHRRGGGARGPRGGGGGGGAGCRSAPLPSAPLATSSSSRLRRRGGPLSCSLRPPSGGRGSAPAAGRSPPPPVPPPSKKTVPVVVVVRLLDGVPDGAGVALLRRAPPLQVHVRAPHQLGAKPGGVWVGDNGGQEGQSVAVGECGAGGRLNGTGVGAGPAPPPARGRGLKPHPKPRAGPHPGPRFASDPSHTPSAHTRTKHTRSHSCTHIPPCTSPHGHARPHLYPSLRARSMSSISSA
jgi:hypothetical protein